jgi:hypothetical protein
VDSITSNLPAIALILAGLGITTMLVMQALQVSHLSQRLDLLTRGVDGESLEGVLDAHLELVHQVSEDLDELTSRTSNLETTAEHHFARVGLVRFNPFPDTGGNQSFALAMLDESDDGFIVSSLHSRTGTRLYAKAVAAGKADNTLSSEESEAIDIARARKSKVRPAAVPPRPAQRPVPTAASVRPMATPVPPAREPTTAPVAAPLGSNAVATLPPLRPAATVIRSEPAIEPEPEDVEPAVPVAAAPVAPEPRKPGQRGRMGFLAALRPGGAPPEVEEESAVLPEIAEPPVRLAAPARTEAPASSGTDRKDGFAGQRKSVADSGPDEDFDPDRTGRRPGSIGR